MAEEWLFLPKNRKCRWRRRTTWPQLMASCTRLCVVHIRYTKKHVCLWWLGMWWCVVLGVMSPVDRVADSQGYIICQNCMDGHGWMDGRFSYSLINQGSSEEIRLFLWWYTIIRYVYILYVESFIGGNYEIPDPRATFVVSFFASLCLFNTTIPHPPRILTQRYLYVQEVKTSSKNRLPYTPRVNNICVCAHRWKSVILILLSTVFNTLIYH